MLFFKNIYFLFSFIGCGCSHYFRDAFCFFHVGKVEKIQRKILLIFFFFKRSLADSLNYHRAQGKVIEISIEGRNDKTFSWEISMVIFFSYFFNLKKNFFFFTVRHPHRLFGIFYLFCFTFFTFATKFFLNFGHFCSYFSRDVGR